MPSRRPSVLLLAALVACGGAAAPERPPLMPAVVPLAEAPSAPTVVAPPGEDDAAIPISPRNPIWGSRTALVTIVEFADLQCPFSAKAQATLAELRTKYGPDDLRIVWKSNPLAFHPNARPAAIAAAGVFALGGGDAFWRFTEALYTHQGEMAPAAYERWAGEAGVKDLDEWRAGLTKGAWADSVDADLRDGKAAGVTGTPAFFVNGVLLSGAQPFEKFAGVVDAELAKAHARVEAGTPRDRVYAELARENRASAPKVADAAPEKPADTTTVYKIPLGGGPVRGKPTALVTIVELADFQCPYSARVEPTLAAVLAKYGDKVRLVYRNLPLPFHKQAEPAAEAALEVRAIGGDAAFFAMHDKLFAGQKDLSEDAIVAMATQLGASAARIKAAMTGHTHARAIAADQDLADDFEASGTPHFFIDGRRLVGAQPEAKFDAIVDEELEKAEALVAKGTRPADVYAALTRDGKGPKLPETKDLPPGLLVGDPVRGAAGARVTVHEFADFQCPFCGRVEPTVARLLKDFTGRVKLVWHDLPLPMHADAPLAAQAAREAYRQRGSAGFFTLHDTLFANQDRLKRNDLDAYAAALGLAMDPWNLALDGGKHSPEITADKDAAAALGISGTPAFLIAATGAKRGYYVSGAQTYEKFRRLVDRALAEGK